MPFHFLNFKLRSLLALTLTLIPALFLFACQHPSQSNNQSFSSGSAKPPTTPAPATISTESENLPTIVAFGDSLTAGYGLSSDQAYTTLLQQKLEEHGFRYRIVNAGVSGDTSAGGARRIDWALQSGNVKFLILELGANDGLRGLPVQEMKKNLEQIIQRAQSAGVTVILAGMEAPPNFGAEYTREFRQVFHDLAKQYKTPFIPFVLEGIGGNQKFNQSDGIHPNAEGEKIMTENVWRSLQPLLTK
ncbi:MAG: arylesterase [Acidobacteria bacterium]|nr:arylesterase [Acidobacteriota bacterium]